MRYYLVEKDLVRRRFFRTIEKKRSFFKFMQQNLSLSFKSRKRYSEILHFYPVNSSISRIRNRCVLTGRGRSIYRDFRLSRMQLRHMASFGLLMGVKKSSW